MRFLIANTTDYNPVKDAISYQELRSVDKFLLVRLNETVQTIKDAYQNYQFITIYKTVMNFLTTEVSAFYLDFAKDVVYIEAENAFERRAMQTVFYEILVTLTKLLTPIIPHTAEEIWAELKEEEAYVQLAEFPEVNQYPDQAALKEEWIDFLAFRNQVLKALEVARNEKLIGKSLEAKVTIYPSEPVKVLLTTLDEDIAQLLIVSDFAIAEGEAPESAQVFEDVKIVIEHAAGETCVRCRRVDETVGQSSNPNLVTVCSHCAEILEANFPEAVASGFEE